MKSNYRNSDLAAYQAGLGNQITDKKPVPDFVFSDPQEASVKVMVDGADPVTLIATDPIRKTLDGTCYKQIANTAQAPGIDKVVISPDFHMGYGCPVGSAFSSRSHIYPCAVGPDISCSMAFMSVANMTAADFADHSVRRTLIEAIGDRIPSGPGAPEAPKGRRFDSGLLRDVAIQGATPDILSRLGIDPEWGNRLEDRSRGNPERLAERFHYLSEAIGQRWTNKLKQIGSLGGGNHFLSQEQVSVTDPEAAKHFGLTDGALGFLTHCGSRGFGFTLTESKDKPRKDRNPVVGGTITAGFSGQFEKLARLFEKRGWEFPGGDRLMVFAEVGTKEGDEYLDDMYLGANFAIVNHLLILSLVEEALHSVHMGASTADCRFIYHIAHNIIREETDIETGEKVFVHRKGTTRAFPGSHPDLAGAKYEGVGHPILLPGNCEAGSAIMVGAPGAKQTLYSVNHGAGRCWGRAQAKRELAGIDIGKRMTEMDILSNCRTYPLDEAAASYKDFNEVLKSVEKAGLATMVARLVPKGGFVFKDNDDSAEGKA